MIQEGIHGRMQFPKVVRFCACFLGMSIKKKQYIHIHVTALAEGTHG